MLTAFYLNSLLISVRLLPIFVVAPILLLSRLPVKVRLLLVLALAATAASALSSAVVPPLTPSTLGGEFLLGVAMAFGFHAAQAGIDMVGRLIDTQIGLNAAGVFDPATENTTSLVAQLLVLSFSVLFITLNFHHELLRAFARLLELVPPGAVSRLPDAVSLAELLTQQGLLALFIMTPLALGLWLTDVAFALMSRSMPQANIYFVALPVKLGVGFTMLFLSLPLVVQKVPVMFERVLHLDALLGTNA